MLSVGSHSTCTDASGRFLLTGLPGGRQILGIDGHPASTGTRQYGTFEAGVDVLIGRTTPLPFTVWMPLLDVANRIEVPLGTPGFTLESPQIPGLSIRIPAGAHLETTSGQHVTEVTLTPVATDRAPFPTPTIGGTFPMYFTIQPEGLVVVGGRAEIDLSKRGRLDAREPRPVLVV